MCCTKNWQKWIWGEKVTTSQNKGVIFTKKKSLIKHLIAYFQTPLKKKSLKKYYSVAYSVVLPLELQDDL
jgi:hypothetical protein